MRRRTVSPVTARRRFSLLVCFVRPVESFVCVPTNIPGSPSLLGIPRRHRQAFACSTPDRKRFTMTVSMNHRLPRSVSESKHSQ